MHRACVLCMLPAVAALTPASGRGEDAFAYACRQKLDVVYRATMQFVADHGGYLPPAWMSPEVRKPFVGRGHWLAHLEPYLGRMGERSRVGYRAGRRQPAALVSHCPANPYWYGGNGPYCIGYAWNNNLGARAVVKGKQVGPVPVRFKDVLDRDRTVLVVDAAMMPERPPYCVYRASHPREAGPWHHGKAHVLFLDGHIEALSPAEIKESWFTVKVKSSASSGREPPPPPKGTEP